MIPITCKLGERGVIGHLLLGCNLERKLEQYKDSLKNNIKTWGWLAKFSIFFVFSIVGPSILSLRGSN